MLRAFLGHHQQVHPEQDSVGEVHGLDVIHRVLGGALPDAAGDDGPRQHKDERVGNILQLMPASATFLGLPVDFAGEAGYSSSKQSWCGVAHSMILLAQSLRHHTCACNALKCFPIRSSAAASLGGGLTLQDSSSPDEMQRSLHLPADGHDALGRHVDSCMQSLHIRDVPPIEARVSLILPIEFTHLVRAPL